MVDRVRSWFVCRLQFVSARQTLIAQAGMTTASHKP